MKISNIHNSELLRTNLEDRKKIKDSDFKSFLLESIDKLNSYENEAKEMGLKLAVGEIDNIHEAIIASQKSEIALQFAIEVRNKVLDAYKEIMRMQI
ncbi:flagellar hook-basal body complex protein FliE [Paramaledivibacter caminithermalis]|uniref:Flagellar hook-basal body complex protein FliE n=1 Tax=Paramaledivibacter caminithermalis (strain DSM 15212 / CIP 107654 / DViRD3) TaxID=1121301 RepID=A0A1M6N7Z2_PARC5|nr:flagellar hook-basal body complex protein FliE [Paramaledivibacter caminithermalis]SHJ91868.1 flagellar hook-basal body complex protein FliE [Paramaledivibacter caminithermalis DSM 15212]